jgi:hypothetical protein
MWVVVTTIISLLAALADAQDSQFLFDANGNLFIQTAEVAAPPQIIGQPQNVIALPGEAASFFVVAANTRLLSYQWRFSGADIGGATNDALLLQNVSTNNEGEYRVVLTNPSGSVTSAPALLMIDTDADGIADSWERTYFTNLNQNATADFDGDGASNLQEFLDGTIPTNSTSIRYRLLVIRDAGSVVKSRDQPSYTNGEVVTLTAVASSGGEPFHGWLGDIVTRSNVVTLVMTNDKTVYARFTPIAFTWTSPASGDWNTATNWTPNFGPGSNDTIIIARNVTVTLNSAADCADVTLGEGSFTPTLTGSGTLIARGNFLWAAGTMSGSGRTLLEPGAILNLDGSSTKALNTRTLENGGTALWTGSGPISMLNNSVITNRAGALFHAQNAASFSFGGTSPRFDNAGTFRKSVNAGTLTVQSGIAFNNSGNVEIQTGTLSLGGGGTHNGSFAVAGDATLMLSGGTHMADASSGITGGGQFTVSGGTANLAGLVSVSGTNTFSPNGTANLTGNYICTNNTLVISGNGGPNFNGTGIVAPAVVTLSGATLGGSNLVTVLNQMNWTGGTMSGSGRTVIEPGATLNVANPSTVTLSTRALENGGTALWTGTGVIGMNNNSVITNRPGALFHAQNAATFSFGGGACRFDNAGTFRKSVNTGTLTLLSGITFNNSGTVDIRNGKLAANGGYTSTANALLNCALGGTTPGTNYGQLQVAGTVTLNGALGVDLINGFVPATNDLFTVLTAGTRNGAFASFLYPSNTLTMQLSNTTTSVIVRVTDVLTTIPQPMLLPPEIFGTDFKLTWTAVSNAIYRVEFNPNLAPSNWTALPGDIIGVSNIASKLEALTASNRFYRIRVLP